MASVKAETLQLQERDIALLRGLFESRVMTAAHAAKLHFDGNHVCAVEIANRKYTAPVPPLGTVRRRPLFILPSGQGRSSPSRSGAFHRARYACDFGCHSESAERLTESRPHKGRVLSANDKLTCGDRISLAR